MRKPILAPCSLALAALLGGAAGCSQKAAPPPPPAAAPRTPSLALQPLPEAPSRGDGGTLRAEIARIQGALRAGPSPETGDAETWARLGRAFVRLARQESQPALYAQAGDAADRALALSAEHRGALEVRQAVLLNDHRFAEARRLAEQIVRRAPQDPVAWGTIGDAALEVGDYEAATAAYQRMIDLKPDLRSYSRGAWMRWLVGDGEGAVELMQQAADSGAGESRHFCLVQLGELHFLRGSYDAARAAYDTVLREAPGYAAALSARGRLRLATGQVDGALADLRAALQALPLTQTRASYVEALWAAGRDDEARAELATLDRQGRREDPRALSLFYSTHDLEPKAALELARREAEVRPDIFSLDALAWALYRSGQLDAAWDAIQRASRLGTRDPRLRYHRGRIAAARKAPGEAIDQLKLALSDSPRWDPREPAEARALLARLQGGR